LASDAPTRSSKNGALKATGARLTKRLHPQGASGSYS
jgi:hypothetical protein